MLLPREFSQGDALHVVGVIERIAPELNGEYFLELVCLSQMNDQKPTDPDMAYNLVFDTPSY